MRSSSSSSSGFGGGSSSSSSSSGYATPRFSAPSSSALNNSSSLSNMQRVLENLSATLPSHASLQAALSNNPTAQLQFVQQQQLQQQQQMSQSLNFTYSQSNKPRRGGLASYYERRVGSSQGHRRHGSGGSSGSGSGSGTSGGVASTSHGYHSISQNGSVASSPVVGSAGGFNNAQYLNALMGKGGTTTATGRPSLLIQTATKPGQHSTESQQLGADSNNISVSVSVPAGSLALSAPPSGPAKGSICLSPIQSKKKSVRWSESLENFDTGKGAGVGGVTWSKVASGSGPAGEKTTVVLKGVLVHSNSSSSSHSSGARTIGNSSSTLAPGPGLNVRPSTTSSISRDSQTGVAQLTKSTSSSAIDTGSAMPSPVVTTAARNVPLPSLKAQAASSSSSTATGRRPSLSDQLAMIGAKAEALTADIKSKAGIPDSNVAQGAGAGDAPLFVVPSKCLTVGTLNCRYPSPARFFRDRIEYTFHHPFETSEVEMTMFYRDMVLAVMQGDRMKFKLQKKLQHFPLDFDPSNPSHTVSIELGSSFAAATVREKVLPLICK